MFSPSIVGEPQGLRKTKNYNGIDLVKFLCAFLVIAIHIAPFGGGGVPIDGSGLAWQLDRFVVHYLCRPAVPFFFVASGFFLFRKMPLDALQVDTIRNYCFRILRLWALWLLLLFMGPTQQMWYLEATVVAVVCVSLCFRFGLRLRHVALIAGVLYAIGLMGDSYYGLAKGFGDVPVLDEIITTYIHMFGVTRNGVFMGFIYVLMGAYFAHHEVRLKPLTALIGFAVSMLCMLGEVYVLIKLEIPLSYNMYIFLLPTVYFLFAFACNVRLTDHPIYKHLRVIGMLIYFMHVMVSEVLGYSFRRFLGADTVPYRFLLTTILTLALAIFIRWLSCKEKFRWLIPITH